MFLIDSETDLFGAVRAPRAKPGGSETRPYVQITAPARRKITAPARREITRPALRALRVASARFRAAVYTVHRVGFANPRTIAHDAPFGFAASLPRKTHRGK